MEPYMFETKMDRLVELGHLSAMVEVVREKRGKGTRAVVSTTRPQRKLYQVESPLVMTRPGNTAEVLLPGCQVEIQNVQGKEKHPVGVSIIRKSGERVETSFKRIHDIYITPQT